MKKKLKLNKKPSFPEHIIGNIESATVYKRTQTKMANLSKQNRNVNRFQSAVDFLLRNRRSIICI